MAVPLMPKATAVWLIDKTSLSFEQIAEFVGMHALEIQAIADGEVAIGIVGHDPITSGQLTREEIARCEADPATRLNLSRSTLPQPTARGKGARYTPVSKRNDKPNAIAWLLKNHPDLSEAQIAKLIGTTKDTIAKVRDRTHWNAANIKPADPVTLGLCSQGDLNAEAEAVRDRRGREGQPAAEHAANHPATESPASPEEHEAA
ncbi:MAG: DUF1013 domain-containing protein [Acetobacteraceae bacterium]|nr:DUF1013 domain-containing protein [Acetobacteraceae bacterium]